MRKLFMWNVITLDGFFEGSKPWDLDFHQTVWGDELAEFTREQLGTAGVIIYGKNTYIGMADYWSKEKGETAEALNKIKKVVFSSTLKAADWNNTEIMRDAVEEIPKLKQDGEGDMFVFGSGELSRSLMVANLFDEYRLCVAPVFLGQGRRLFEGGLPYQKLKLIEDRTLKSGGVLLFYGVQ